MQIIKGNRDYIEECVEALQASELGKYYFSREGSAREAVEEGLVAETLYIAVEQDEFKGFFYYIPKGVLKKKPVNVYEIPNKFNLDENQYLKLVELLFNKIIFTGISYSIIVPYSYIVICRPPSPTKIQTSLLGAPYFAPIPAGSAKPIVPKPPEVTTLRVSVNLK